MLANNAGQQSFRELHNSAALRKGPQKKQRIMKANKGFNICRIERSCIEASSFSTDRSSNRVRNQAWRFPASTSASRNGSFIISVWLASETRVDWDIDRERFQLFASRMAFPWSSARAPQTFADLTRPNTTNKLVTRMTVKAIAGRKANTRSAGVDDFQGEHCGDQPARQHPEQQLRLPARHVPYRPSAALHGEEAGQQQGGQNAEDRNDVLRPTNSATIPSRTKKNDRTRKLSSAWKASMRVPWRAIWGVRGKLARVMPKTRSASSPLPPKIAGNREHTQHDS